MHLYLEVIYAMFFGYISRGAFRTQSNIKNGAFVKIVNS